MLRNRFTGEKIEVGWMNTHQRSMWLLRKRLADLDRYVAAKEWHVSFLTITVTDSVAESGVQWVSGVMRAMRNALSRSGVKMAYAAVLEIQNKRYLTTGVLAPHWHIAIACSERECLPHAEVIKVGGKKRIRKVRNGSVVTWPWLLQNVKQKFGMYFCCDAYYDHGLYGYLRKYLSKGDEIALLRHRAGRRIRLFSASRIPVEFQMTPGQADDYARMVADVAEIGELYWRREGARLIARAKEVTETEFPNGAVVRKTRYPKVLAIDGDWVPDNPAPPGTMGIGDQAEPD